jgi:hypothetical protein
MARALGDPVYPKVPSRHSQRREDDPARSADHVDPRMGSVPSFLARGRYGRSMKTGPRAINEDGIDRAKAPNTSRFSKARSMRSVLRATTAGEEIAGVRRPFGLDPPREGHAEKGDLWRSAAPKTTPAVSYPEQCGAPPTKPPTCVGRLSSKPPFRDARERSSRSIDRIDRATTSLDKVPAKRGDLRRSITRSILAVRGGYPSVDGRYRRRYRPPDVP